ncbi:hypothetical protein K458DRAFT_63824 [Lentithecium fluviatile CBS 122367]|uniref:Uncharacterized protein n=1 Tax=Lentithecium fluviatile CBS 122367 TaxID=1168545 RepID=A0A6G1JJX2_9PLEO|nr:hypothetical protein K458DRAFT_63824 [Lentithecium fluviatile CBS 122367]
MLLHQLCRPLMNMAKSCTRAMSRWQKSAYISSDELSDSLSRECNFRALTAEPITLAGVHTR